MMLRGPLSQPVASPLRSWACPGSQAFLTRLCQMRQRRRNARAEHLEQGPGCWAVRNHRLHGNGLGGRSRAHRLRCRAETQPKGQEGLPAEPPSIVIEIGVVKGDTLESKAAALGIPYEKLLAANHGRKQVKAGEKLRFKLALPADQEGLAALLTPNKDAVRAALLERRARQQQQGQQQQQTIEPAASGQRSVMLETARYLGTSAVKVLLLGSVLWALLRLARAATGSHAKPSTNANDLTWPEGAPSPPWQPPNTAEQRKGGGGSVASANGSRPAEHGASHVSNRSRGASTSANSGPEGSFDLLSGESKQALPRGAYSGEDPPWLALPAVYYAQLPGGQQPSFRMADTRAWLAWEDPEDLRRLVRCMAGSGLMPMDEAGVHMVPIAPYEYLQTAEYNGRAVAFIPKGTQVQEDCQEEALMAALQSAAQLVPREPEQAPNCAPAILARWRARSGVALADKQPSAGSGAEGSNGAWEVRSSLDEDDTPRAPETLQTEQTAAEMHHQHDQQQAFTNYHQQTPVPSQGSPSPRSEGQPSASSEHDASRRQESHRHTMWQRLKRLVKGGSSGEAGSGAALGEDQAGRKPGCAEPDLAAGGQLNAGRILERSASEAGRGGSMGSTDFMEQLFGPGIGAAHAQDGAAASNGAGWGANTGAPGAGGAAGSVQGESTNADREARYAAALRSRSATGDVRSRLEQVRQEDYPFEAALNREPDKVNPHHAPSRSHQNGASASQHTAADRASDSSGSSSARHPDTMQPAGQPPSGWWHRLALVHAPVRHFSTGGTGFLTADLSQEEGVPGGGGGGAPDQAPRALVAFADRNDAQRVQWLWDSWGEEEPGRNSVMALPPGQLGDVAQGQGLGVAVFDKGQLPLRPGMSEEELGAIFDTYAGS